VKIEFSAVLSVHNRSTLLRRALLGYLWQTVPSTNWEILLVDDMSTEDLSEVYKPFIGRMNLRHIKIDHRRHPMWKSRNPNGVGNFENWYHTPAITINAGTYMARGRIICLCHPEILHAPTNFLKAKEAIDKEKVYVFGKTYLGTQAANRWLDTNPGWTDLGGWDGFLKRLAPVDPLHHFRPNELYWYTSFIPKEAVERIGGVDFDYLNGVAGEDDDFKERAAAAGWRPVLVPEVEGFHQDHSDEKEAHRRRDTAFWEEGLARNRALFSARKKVSGFPKRVNEKYDWTAKETIVDVVEHKVS
jgi:glycosyltransferase involved in cell wall biosynthesis